MESDPSVEFALPARIENVALIRHALSGLAETLGMEAGEVADLKTVVTEACTNVVSHAYEPDQTGELIVSAGVAGNNMVIRVRDFGRGIRPLADVERRSLRLGLPLIAALTDGLEVGTSPGGGTTLTMRLKMGTHANGDGARPVRESASETRIEIDAGAVLAPVLSRVISMFATRADFSVDRLADVVLLSDAISAGSPDRFPRGRATLHVAERTGGFEVRIGPLNSDGAQRLLDGMRIPELDASLETLAEEVRIDRDGEDEFVVMRIDGAA